MGSSSKTVLGAGGAAMCLAGLLAVDCGGATDQQCVPGATQVCVGPGACMGGQACRNDGTGFEPCVCGAPVDGGPDVFVGASSSGGSGSGSGSSSGAGSSSGGGSSSGSVPEAGPWDCLNDPSQTFQPGAMTTVKVLAMDGEQPTLRAQEIDGGSGLDTVQYTPMTGVSIRACSSLLDVQCAVSGSPWVTDDDAGVALFTLPQPFDGFFQFAGTNLFTTSLDPGAFLSGDTMFALPAPLILTTVVPELENVLSGVPIALGPDSGAGVGHVLLTAFDCNDHSAPGVTFLPGAAASPGSGYVTEVFYTVGNGGSGSGIPSTTASATDSSGFGGILNVPVGDFTVKATLASSGQPIAAVTTFVNPGVATLVYIRVRTH